MPSVEIAVAGATVKLEASEIDVFNLGKLAVELVAKAKEAAEKAEGGHRGTGHYL